MPFRSSSRGSVGGSARAPVNRGERPRAVYSLGARRHRSAPRPRGPRLHARPGRPVLHAPPRRPGRARRQDRARRAAATTCARGTSSSSRDATTRAPTSPGSTSARRAWASTSGAPRRARSCSTSRAKADVAVENFAPGVAARLGLGLRGARRRQARPRLLLHLRLRPDGAVARAPRLRPHHQRRLGSHAPRPGRCAGAAVRRTSRPPTCCRAPTPSAPSSPRSGAARGRARARGSTSRCWRRSIAADDVSIAAVLNGGEEIGSPRPGMGVYEIGGRHLALQTVGSTELWPRLLEMMDRPELANDPRFATAPARREHWPLLRDLIGQWLTRFRTVDEALAALGAARIPAAPVLEPREVIAHPHPRGAPGLPRRLAPLARQRESHGEPVSLGRPARPSGGAARPTAWASTAGWCSPGFWATMRTDRRADRKRRRRSTLINARPSRRVQMRGGARRLQARRSSCWIR